jgi:hypothetical protein
MDAGAGFEPAIMAYETIEIDRTSPSRNNRLSTYGLCPDALSGDVRLVASLQRFFYARRIAPLRSDSCPNEGRLFARISQMGLVY